MDNNKKLLLVVEKKQFRDQAGQALKKTFDLKFASGGFHAIHLIEEEKFGLIVIVGNSDEMPAIELITLLRTSYNQQDLPILFLYPKGSSEMLDAIEAGANAYLPISQNLNPMIKKIQEMAH
jgi:PleD family two-component response regulator